MELLHEPFHRFAGEQDLDNVPGRHDGRALVQRDFRDADQTGATFDHYTGQLTRNTNAQLNDHFAASSDSYQPSFRDAPDGPGRRRPGTRRARHREGQLAKEITFR